MLLLLVFNSHGRRENALDAQTALLDRRTGVCVCACVCVCVCVCVCLKSVCVFTECVWGRKGGVRRKGKQRGRMASWDVGQTNVTSVMEVDSGHLLK